MSFKYYRCFPVLLFCFCLQITKAQQSGTPDTSFTFNSAYQSVKKVYPNAGIPQLNLGDSVKSTVNIVYGNVKGRRLLLDVFYPAKTSAAKLPAVLLIFGGGWRSGNRGMHIPMAKALAAMGFVTITADYRLSAEALYPAAVNDLKAAIKWMRVNAGAYQIDKTKIAVWGFSAGGQLAALIGTTADNKLYNANGIYQKQSDAVQAIVDVDGILAFIHPESGEGDDTRHTSAANWWFGGPKTQHPELRQQASALNHINSKTPPMLFINSSVTRMHAGRDDAISKLDVLHIYHEVHTFSDAPHPFILFDPWFWPSVAYTVSFLDRVLKVK